MKKFILLLAAVLFAAGVYLYIDNSEFSERIIFSSSNTVGVVEKNPNKKYDGAPSFDNLGFKYAEVIDDIRKGYSNFDQSINLRKYKITLDELNDIVQYLNIEKCCYYLKNDFRYYLDGEYIRSYNPDYTMNAEEIIKYNEEIEDEINRIAAGADKFKTDIEKLIYIHDYIVENICYDSDENVDTNNIYGALVLKKTMCSGYAQAFKLIAEKLGYKTYVVISNEIKHAWNMVLLNGKYYFVDCTWDDPVFTELSLSADPVSGYGSYKYFMCSEQEFSKKYTSKDWKVNGESIIGVADSSVYDNFCWRKYESLMRYADGIWFHDYGYDTDRIYSVKDVKFSIDRILFTGNESCDVKTIRTIHACWTIGLQFYTMFDSTLQEYNGAVYYMTDDGIYRLTDGGRTNGKDDDRVFKNPTNENIYDFDIDAPNGTFKVVYGNTDENTENNASEVVYNISDYF